MITNISKDGHFILFQTAEKETPIKFDCKEMELISFTGRKIKIVPSIMHDCTTTAQSLVATAVSDYVYHARKNEVWEMNRTKDIISRYEPFIPYLDRVDYFPDECPKGFIKWVLDHDLRFSSHALQCFHVEVEVQKQAKQFSKIDQQTIKTLTDYYIEGNYRIITNLFSLPNKRIKLMLKLFRATIKNGVCWNLDYDFRRFLDNVLDDYYSSFPEDWEEYVDTNRSFEYNMKNFEILKETRKKQQIISQENKIRTITDLSNETYTIIVPETLEQFTNEGKQQNNCVGHYYHNNIAGGVDFIYFIRKTENPNKSYITCRYNVSAAGTIEHRTKNNRPNNDAAAVALIIAIDKRIKELLTE